MALNDTFVHYTDTQLLQFPTVCDYHDATYTIRLLNSNGILVHQTTEKMYNKEGPDYVQVKIINSPMKVNMMYFAEIVVKTAVNSTTARFSFSEYSNYVKCRNCVSTIQ